MDNNRAIYEAVLNDHIIMSIDKMIEDVINNASEIRISKSESGVHCFDAGSKFEKKLIRTLGSLRIERESAIIESMVGYRKMVEDRDQKTLNDLDKHFGTNNESRFKDLA